MHHFFENLSPIDVIIITKHYRQQNWAFGLVVRFSLRVGEVLCLILGMAQHLVFCYLVLPFEILGSLKSSFKVFIVF